MKNDKAGNSTKAGERSQRLAAELRENLRRRKAQERGRKTPGTHESVKQPGRPQGGKQTP
jgi:hypothetical protein